MEVTWPFRKVGTTILLVLVSGVSWCVIDDEIQRRSHVTWEGLNGVTTDKFEQQLREALPAGTSKESVETYLRQEKIPFQYDDKGRAFNFYNHEVSAFPWPLYGNFHGWVSLDENLKVERVGTVLQLK